MVPPLWPDHIALFTGWARIRSGSIVGPWLAHAAPNITMGLSVAVRSANL